MSSFIDKNFESITTTGFNDAEFRTIDPGKEFNDTVKLSSNVWDVTYSNKTVINWVEDCLDLCRVFSSRFYRLKLFPRGRNGITVKGASVGNNFWEIEFGCHGSECDIELGQFDNYWYPGRPPTSHNAFSARPDPSTTGSVIWGYPADAVDPEHPVKIILWDAETNTFDFKHVSIKRVPKYIWFPYFLFRYVSLRAENLIRRLRKLPAIATK